MVELKSVRIGPIMEHIGLCARGPGKSADKDEHTVNKMTSHTALEWSVNRIGGDL